MLLQLKHSDVLFLFVFKIQTYYITRMQIINPFAIALLQKAIFRSNISGVSIRPETHVFWRMLPTPMFVITLQ